MFAIVEAEMSTSLSAPRCSRSGASGALDFENRTDAASLIVSLPESSHSGALVIFGKRFPAAVNLSNPGMAAQDPGRQDQVVRVGGGACGQRGGRGRVLSRSTTSPGTGTTRGRRGASSL